MRDMAIRVKVWQVLLVLLLLTVSGFTLAFISDQKLLERGLEARRRGDHARAAAMFDRFVERCPSCPRAAEALYYTAGHFRVTQQDYSYVYSDGSYGWSKTTSLPGIADDAESRYRRLIDQYANDSYSWRAREDLARLLLDEGRYEEALELIERFLAEEPPDLFIYPQVRNRLEHLQILAEFGLGHYERVIELAQTFHSLGMPPAPSSSSAQVESDASGGRMLVVVSEYGPGSSRDESPADAMQRQIAVAESYLKLGDVEQALYWFEEANATFKWGRPPGTPNILRWEQVKASMNGLVGAVSGSIDAKWEGELEAFISEAVMPTPALEREEVLILSTPVEPDGTFRLEAIPPGEYWVGLRAPGQQEWLRNLAYVGPKTLSVEPGSDLTARFRMVRPIQPAGSDGFVHVSEDAITVAWEPVEGATHYELQFGITHRWESGSASMSQPVIMEATETRHTFDPLVLRWTVMARSFGYRGPNSEVYPHSLLGYLYPGGNYYVQIIAYDELGKMATSSRDTGADSHSNHPAQFTFQDASQLSREERLLLEGKYEEALAGLERRWAEDPHDLTAGLVLLRVYSHGTNLYKEHADRNRAAELAREILKYDLPAAVRDEVARVSHYEERNG